MAHIPSVIQHCVTDYAQNIDIMKKLFYGVALLAVAGLSACGSKTTTSENQQAPLPLPDAAYDSTYVKEVSEAADEQVVVTETDTVGGEIVTDTISQDTVVSDGSTIVPQ